MNALERLASTVVAAETDLPFVHVGGIVSEVAPGHYRVRGLPALVKLGDRVRLDDGARSTIGEVVRIDEADATVKPFVARFSVGIGMVAKLIGAMHLHPTPEWKGRVVNALGEPIDDRGALDRGETSILIDSATARRDDAGAHPTTAADRRARHRPVHAALRGPARRHLRRVRASASRRVLSMIARSSAFDTVVVALVGERGREVREFLEGPLGRQPGALHHGRLDRRREPDDAAAGAAFRHGDRRVFPRPWRVGSAHRRLGHPLRPRRARRGAGGRRTGGGPRLYAQRFQRLAEDSRARRVRDPTAPARSPASSPCWSTATTTTIPVADAIRGTLDGHIVLDRAIADQGRYPAVNVLGVDLAAGRHRAGRPSSAHLVRTLKTMIARFEDTRDLRLMGGYHAGTRRRTRSRRGHGAPHLRGAAAGAVGKAEHRRLRRAGAGAAPVTRTASRKPSRLRSGSIDSVWRGIRSMSLYGALRTGVSGMNAQSTKLGTIADNIANTGTTGYKAGIDAVLGAGPRQQRQRIQFRRGRHRRAPHDLQAGSAGLHHLVDRPRHPGQRLPRRLRSERPALPDPRRLVHHRRLRPATSSTAAASRCSATSSTTAIRTPCSTASATSCRST